jgi:hypothetical protein
MPAIISQIQNAIRTRLVDELDFNPEFGDPARAINDASITIRKISDIEKPLNLPGIIIAAGSRMSVPSRGGTNERDDYPIPVVIQIVDNDNGDQYANRETYQVWAERIARAFNQQTLSGVEEVYITLAQTVDYIDPKLMKQHRKFVGGVVCVFIARATRGVT